MATPEAIYVGRRGEHARRIAEHVGVPIRVLHGIPAAVILREAVADDVALAVIGARGLQSGPFPVGRVTRRVIQQLPKATVVVPPHYVPTKLAHVLVPLDGTRENGRAVAALVDPLRRFGAELVILHVLTPDTTPTMLDHTGALEMWAEDFVRRVCPELADAPMELRVGAPGARVSEFTRAEPTDLIVLAWRRKLSGGHGQVVLDSMAHAGVPVLLLPIGFELGWPMTHALRRPPEPSPVGG